VSTSLATGGLSRKTVENRVPDPVRDRGATLCSGSSYVGRSQGLRLTARRHPDWTPHIGTHWSSLR